MQDRKPWLFVDVETTGLTYADRVITLGLIEYDPETSSVDCQHLIFNPGRPSNPFARAVHGYDDWQLRGQDPFDAHIPHLHARFSRAGRVFAHNAAFDERFLRTEFSLAGGRLEHDAKFECTLRAYKARHKMPGGLDKVIAHMGLESRGKQHGALEDAWLCMRVHLWLNDMACPEEIEDLRCVPQNWIEPEEPPLRGARILRR